MRYRFDEIAYNSTAKKKPTEVDKETYIGLEHLDSECLTISRWGSEVAPVGEKLIMKKGDILFGKRRAYQRKVGIAPFDGIFSAHGMVLRPNEEVINPNFFPFFISSDQFMERAVRISVGGLSPTINWKDLREQEFDIPSLDEQKELADKLWAAYNLKESYKKLLSATDEMVKSQFIEMFKDENLVPLGNICNIEKGATITRNDVQPGNIPVVAGGQEPSCYHNISNREAGAITVSASGAYAGYINFWDCPIFASDCNTIIPKDVERVDQTFIYFGLKSMQQQIYSLQKGGAQPHVYGKDLQKFLFPNPPYAKQIVFSEIAKQADKSKLIQNTLLNNKLKFCYCYTPRHISS